MNLVQLTPPRRLLTSRQEVPLDSSLMGDDVSIFERFGAFLLIHEVVEKEEP